MSKSIYEAALRRAEEERQARIAAWNAGCYAASHGLPCTAPYDDEAINVEYRKGYDTWGRLSQSGGNWHERPRWQWGAPAEPPAQDGGKEQGA